MSIFDYFKRSKPRTPLRATGGRRTPEHAYSTLSEEEARGFLEDGDYLPVISSCVRGAQFHREARTFMVEWYNPDTGQVVPWIYFDVPESVARAFLAAGSKGSFCSLTFTHAKWPGKPL